MKKIFFIINCYSKGGGAESLLTNIVNNLDETKYSIGVMEIIHDTIKTEPTKPHIKIYPYYVKADDPKRKEKMYYVYHEWDKVIGGYIPQDYDLYVSFNYLKPSFLLPPNKKCIAWIHGDIYDLAVADKQEEKELQRESLKKAKRIVAISDITKKSILELFPEYKDKTQIIYNGIDIKGICKKAEEDCDVVLQHPAILSVGRLDDNKNPVRLLEVFEQLIKKERNIHLYYMGWGSLEEEVKKIAKEKGLQHRVHLLGYRDNPFPIMKQADLLAMFSKSEGFGLAIAEGLCLGIPFIGSDVGALRYLSYNRLCGQVFGLEDKLDIDKVLELLHGNKLEQEINCRQSVERFDLKKYVKSIENLFEEVLEEK